MSVVKAKTIVLDKVSPEIFLAKQSASIWLNIAEYSSRVNGTKFQQAVGLIQLQALSSLVLSLGKLYERPGEKYPNVSIPSVIKYLKEDAENLSVNSASLGKLVNELTDDKYDQLHLLSNPDEVAQIILNDLDEQCPRVPPRDGVKLDEYLEKLKTLRDKQVAHSEDVEVDSLSKANWDAVNELIAFAETFVNLVGFGFFGFSTRGRVNPNDLNLEKELSGTRFGEILNNAISNP